MSSNWFNTFTASSSPYTATATTTATTATTTEVKVNLDRILFSCGIDSNQNQLIILASTYFNEIPNHFFLTSLSNKLQSYAIQGNYSIVLLATPTPFPPSTANLVTQYLQLDRITRKNVKRIYVLGGGWYVRLILSLFSRLSSTKATSKIVQCATMSHLARELTTECFTRIEFPPQVYTANAAIEPCITLPPSSTQIIPVFGSPLESIMTPSTLPRVFRDTIEVLSADLDAIGIFRRSPSGATVKHLQETYDRGHPITLADYPDATYVSASLLKLFLRSLPTPIFDSTLFPVIRACPMYSSITPGASMDYIRTTLLPALSALSFKLLERLIRLLNAIAKNQKVNLMSEKNLVICLGPCLLGGLSDDIEGLKMCGFPSAAPVSSPANDGDDDVGDDQDRRGQDAHNNTVGGILMVLIEQYEHLFDPALSIASSSSSLASTTAPVKKRRPTIPSHRSTSSSSTSSLRLLSPSLASASSSSATVGVGSRAKSRSPRVTNSAFFRPDVDHEIVEPEDQAEQGTIKAKRTVGAVSRGNVMGLFE